MGKRSLFVILIFIICIQYSAAQAASYALPNDTSDTWKVGVTELLGKNLSPENSYLSFSISQIILETVSQCETHRFSANESAAYRKKLIDDRKFEIKKEIDTLITSLDNTFFDPENKREEIVRLQKRLEQKKDELEFIESIYYEDFEVKEEKTVHIVTTEEEGGLFPYPVVSPEHTAERDSLQLLLYGVVEEIEGYLFLEIKAWNTNLEEEVFEYQDGFSKEKKKKKAKLVGEKLLEVVLGQEWAMLTVNTVPDSGDIYIDETFYAQGYIGNVLLLPGTYDLLVEAPGYFPYETAVSLQAGEKTSIEIPLEAKFMERIRVKSIPEDAAVYLDSVWVGSTPVSIMKPESAQQLILQKEGYRDAVLALEPDSEDVLTISLSPDVFEWEDYIEKKQDAFYLSFGLFALSVPIPVILYSLSEDLAAGYNLAYAQRNLGEMERIYKDASITYNTYIGSLFLSATLLVNTLIHLFDYLLTGAR